MFSQFIAYISNKNLPLQAGKTLLAVSGGVDSMTLCYLFKKAGFPFGIAHCNFQLRGAASDADELLVKKQADIWDVPFYTTRFETNLYASQNKLSIQAAARELRYEWLEDIRQSFDYQVIATAHHLDDSIETVLYNFAKGCGIRGLHGILPMNGTIVRPMLFATKKMVSKYAHKQQIPFREDQSNLTDKYNRNKIRQHIVPIFEDINPAFQQTAAETISHLQETEALYDFAIGFIKKEVFIEKGNEWYIDIHKLRSYPAYRTVLYELLRPFLFNTTQIGDILQSIDNQTGKLFYSSKYRLVSDRGELIISLIDDRPSANVFSEITEGEHVFTEGKLTLSISDNIPDEFPKNPHLAWFDADKLALPLTLRRWQPGDKFCPLGMGGKHRKLQDYFNDNKVSIPDKERIWLLESNGDICWIVGMRADERFKVSAGTKRCLSARWEVGNFAA